MLDEREAYLNASGLPDAQPSKPIIERTRLMQSDGQGYYKDPTNGEGWCLLWIELRAGGRLKPLVVWYLGSRDKRLGADERRS